MEPTVDSLGSKATEAMLQQLCSSASAAGKHTHRSANYTLHVKQQQTRGQDMSEEEKRKRGKELDDGFFECYVDAIDKHDRLQAEQIQRRYENVEDESIGGSGWQQIASGDYTPVTLDDKEREEMYRALLRTVYHKTGSTDSTTTASLYSYMQKVFSVSEEEHSTWLNDEIQRVKPAKQFLSVSVIRGVDLKSKELKNTSNIFCELGLVELPPRYLDGKSATENLQTLVKDQSTMRSTQIITATPNPDWNETFEIDVVAASVRNQVLQIDIRIAKTEDAKSEKGITKTDGKSGHGFFRHVGQVGGHVFGKKKTDFLGRIFIPLQDISTDGVEKWYHVLDRKQRQLGGKLLISVCFVIQQMASFRSVCFDSDFSRHVKLQRVIWAFESQEFSESGGNKWNMQLSKFAARLIHQHANWHKLTRLEEALIDWIVVAEHHEIQCIDYVYMLNAVNTLQQEWEAARLKGMNETDVLNAAKLEMFVNSCHQFHRWCAQAFSKLRVVFPSKNKRAIERLTFILKCLETVYNFPIMTKQLQSKSLSQFLSNVLEKSTADWFERQEALVEPQYQTDDAMIEAFVTLTSDVVLDLYQAVKVYSPVLELVGVDFVTLDFKHLDSRLSPRIEQKMKDFNSTLRTLEVESDEFKTLSMASFQLYLALKEIYRYKSELPETVVSEVLLFTKMHRWFRRLVACWFDLANVKTFNRIDKAIELDKVQRVTDLIMYSTSAVDTVQCLFQLCEFWKRLNWPESNTAFAFSVKLTDVICKGVVHYSQQMQAVLEKSGYYDTGKAQFFVGEQLCLSLNNIQYVWTSLSKLVDSLGWDRVIEDLAQENGREAAEQSRASHIHVVASTDDDLRGICNRIIASIAQKMGVNIYRFILPLINDLETVNVEQSITGLMDYLTSNLQTLSNSLFSDVFALVLFEIYRVCIEAMRDTVVDKFDLTPAVYDRLLKAIEIIVPFFHSGGKGLQQEAMEIDQLKELNHMLKLRKKNTSDLIGVYMLELAEEQEQKRVVDHGTVTVQVGFVAPLGKLCVKILNGRNLAIADPTGLCNFSITLEPFPHHIFPEKSRALQKTTVQKKTMTPIFDETFFIECAPSTLTVKGASILFTCFNSTFYWYLFPKDELVGQAICLLSAVKTVENEADVDRLDQMMLLLSVPTEPVDRQSAYHVLNSRTSDEAAVQFIKMRQQIFKMVEDVK